MRTAFPYSPPLPISRPRVLVSSNSRFVAAAFGVRSPAVAEPPEQAGMRAGCAGHHREPVRPDAERGEPVRVERAECPGLITRHDPENMAGTPAQNPRRHAEAKAERGGKIGMGGGQDFVQNARG